MGGFKHGLSTTPRDVFCVSEQVLSGCRYRLKKLDSKTRKGLNVWATRNDKLITSSVIADMTLLEALNIVISIEHVKKGSIMKVYGKDLIPYCINRG